MYTKWERVGGRFCFETEQTALATAERVENQISDNGTGWVGDSGFETKQTALATAEPCVENQISDQISDPPANESTVGLGFRHSDSALACIVGTHHPASWFVDGLSMLALYAACRDVAVGFISVTF